MDKHDVLGAVLSFVAENYRMGEAVLAPDTDLISSEIIDSTGIVMLVEFLEDEFGLEVPDEDIDPDILRDAQSIAKYVIDRQA